MTCEICGGEFPHGNGPAHCLTYGGRVMCYECMKEQPVCRICGRRRMARYMIGGICEGCSGIPAVEEDVEVPRPFVDLDEILGERTEFKTPIPDRGEENTVRHLCEFCGEYVHHVIGAYGPKICARCSYHSGTCGSCGEYGILYHGHCKECVKKHAISIEEGWSYTPHKFKKWGNSKDKLWIGIENEVQMAEGASKRLYLQRISEAYYKDEAYTMHDGTIQYGTEVVFHPRTLELIKKFDFEPMLRNTRPHRNTGMHVHLSREAFSNKAHLYKFMRFFARNKGFVEYVAERKSDMFRAWTFTKNGDVISKLKGYDVDGGKYIDVNLKHEATIEVRVFKGATEVWQIHKNVEFCHALWKFSRSNIPKHMTRLRFEKWLKDKESIYPNLVKHIRNRKEQ